MYRFLILFLFFFQINTSFSQEKSWVNDIMSSGENYFETKESFEAYWENKEIGKGKGWKPVKRWQSFMEPRIGEDGIFPSHQLYTEWEKIRNQARSTTDLEANWTSFGPDDVPLQSNGLKRGVGRVNVVEFDPNNPNIIWVGSPAGGLWKSVDGGQNWTSNTDLLPNLGVSDIAINPLNTNIMYIATGDRDAGDTYAYGIMKSIDGGETWNTTGLSFQVNYAYRGNRILINPNNTNILIASTRKSGYGETFRSIDGGDTWEQVLEGPNFVSMEFNPIDPNIIYAATTGNSKFYKSVDNGQTWTNVTNNSGLPNSGRNRGLVGVTPSNPNVVYILFSANDDGFGGLYKSVDQGINFELQSDSPNLFGWDVDGSDEGGQGWYDLALAISPTNENLVFVGGVNCWKSTNGGQNWDISSHWYGAQGNEYAHADQHMLRFNENGTLFSGNDGGLYKTSNEGNTWEDISDGLQITQNYKIGISQTNPNLLLAGTQDNGTLRAVDENNWDAVRGGDGMECAVDPSNSDIMYSEVYYGALSISNNGGDNWDNIAPDSDGAWVTPYQIDQNNPNRIVIGYDFVYESLNYGESWNNISIDFGGNLDVIALSLSDNNTIYVSNDDNLYKTNDGGENWSNISSEISNNTITGIAVHPENKDRVWVTLSEYTLNEKVYYTEDGGDSWTNISENLPNLPANCVTYHSSNETVFIGTDIGVWYIDSTTTEWTAFNQGMPNVIVNEIEINQNANLMYAATYGRGVWRTELPVNVAPTAQFDYNLVSECSGGLQFENLSMNFDSISWNFGDNTISNEVSPQHFYTNIGTYEITLIVYNFIGSDTISQTVDLDFIEAPLTNDQSNCVASSFTFTTNQSNENSTINWFSDPNGTQLISQGETFVTPVLNTTTSYYVNESQAGTTISDGPENQNSLGAGDFHFGTDWEEVFSCSSNTLLKSVFMYAQEDFSIDVVLKLADGTILESTTINLSQGDNTVDLNFNIPAAQNMTLGLEGENLGLWRNDNVNDYPITIGNNIVVNESTAGEDYFYYFYNWEVEEFCSSNLIEVVAMVGSPEELSISLNNDCLFNNVTLSGLGNFNNFTWNNQQEGNEITVSEIGTYTLTATDTNGCVATQQIDVASINELEISTGLQAFCEGNPVILQISPGLENYEWSNGGNTNMTEVFESGTYSVNATDQNGCEYYDEITLEFNEVQEINIESLDGDIICRGDEFTLSASGGSNSYIWDNSFSGEIYTLTANQTGTQNYSVSSMDNNGCNVTATIELQIIDCTSISETVEQSILLFPNPNSGEFSIYHQAKNDKISVINIYDTRNRLIESRRVNYSNNNLAEKFQLNNNDKGIYFVEMIGDKGTYFQKVVLH